MLNCIARSIFLLLICHTTQISGFFSFDPSWNTVRVTFSPNIFSNWSFAKVPLKQSETKNYGFEQLGNSETPCSGEFNGYRYIKNNDPAVILLFDKNGYIAGIQTSFPENTIETSAALDWFKQSPMFTVEQLPLKTNQTKSYTLTAYFVDPNIICTTGRTKAQFDNENAGMNLYLKNQSKIELVPKQQADLKDTSWTLGKCFVGMGVHYWYNTSKNMDCNNFQPIFLLYNHGILTGFGWAVYGKFNSRRYEHPPKLSLGAFFKIIPECLDTIYKEAGSVSTEHVYMNVYPWNLIC